MMRIEAGFAALSVACIALMGLWILKSARERDVVAPSATWAARSLPVLFACLILAPVAEAQPQGPVKLGAARMKTHPSGSPVEMHSPKKPADGTPVKRSELAVAPIPIINPTIGNGLAGVGMVAVHLDPEDTVSPPSVFGVGGMYTSSKSWALAAGTELFLKEDRFRVIFGVGDGRFNYKFYGTGHESGAAGNALPISQSAFGYLIEPKVRVFERVYVGPRYHFARMQVGVDRNSDLLPDIDPDDPSVPVIPPPDEEVDVAALGLRVERDTRDSQFYPRTGSFIDGKFDFFDPAVGGERTYQTYEVAYQGYREIGSKNVIAYRGAVCAADGDVPFYNLCLLGQSKDIRGYEVGRYQDRRMIVGQVEYRRELPYRFGVVAFFGLGEVAGTLSDINTANILPGGGIGLRWDVAPENHINLRVDYAWGRDSKALYIGMMEVF